MVDKAIVIDGISLQYVSSVTGLTIADSFVKRANKIGSGNGEAKLYIGADSPTTWNFFGAPNFEISCFLLKQDLIRLLSETSNEYINPSQSYLNVKKFPALFAFRQHLVAYLPDILWFEAYEQGQIKGTRVYMKSDSSYFGLIRELCFPNISALDIHKYKNNLGHFFYYFDPHRVVSS